MMLELHTFIEYLFKFYILFDKMTNDWHNIVTTAFFVKQNRTELLTLSTTW